MRVGEADACTEKTMFTKPDYHLSPPVSLDVVGTPNDDTLYANPHYALVPSNIYGGGGNDTLYGGAYNDLLDGGIGDDALHGGGGNDVLHGSEGFDDLWGDAGADTFLWLNVNEAPHDNMGHIDWIHDFNPLQGDKIDLSEIASILGKDHLTFAGDVLSFSGAGSQAGVVYYSDAGNMHDYIIHVADGSGTDHWAMDIGVHLAAGPAPDASWFHLG
jgi:Ca2+-binding RTX toxin-like protein